jgi:hypothetical protein
MPVWVQLRTCKTIERNGVSHSYQAGERISVEKHDAMKWVALGDAVLMDTITGDLPSNAGIVATAGRPQIEKIVRAIDSETQIVDTLGPLQWSRTLIWDSSARLRPDYINIGFNLLARWQVAVPLWSYTELACHISTEADRERTRAVIRELRVPVYDTRLVFVRRCSDTMALIDAWMQEREAGGGGVDAERNDDKLAFHRAMYKVKPVLCALPVSWTGRS